MAGATDGGGMPKEIYSGLRGALSAIVLRSEDPMAPVAKVVATNTAAREMQDRIVICALFMLVSFLRFAPVRIQGFCSFGTQINTEVVK